MILSEICGEDARAYEVLTRQNLIRQYDFLESIITAALTGGLDNFVTQLLAEQINNASPPPPH